MINGLIYQENFLKEQDEILTKIDALPWRNDLKRRTQHYGYIYNYKNRSVDPSMYLGDLPEFVHSIIERLDFDPDQLIINEYLPGQGISAHIDCTPCFKDKIATISLGWKYEMDFIHYDTKEIRSLMLAVGSIAIISGESRYEWLHRIKARSHDYDIPRQRRVSLTFRKVILK